MSTITKIRIDNLANMATDIEHNMKVLLNSPTYRGHIGKGGITGSTVQGSRGSKIFTIDLSAFNLEYGTNFTKTSVTLGVINAKYIESAVKFMITLNTIDLIDGDKLIGFDGIINDFDGANNVWVASDVRLVTESSVVTIDTLQALIQNNSTADSIMYLYNTLTKIVDDDDANANQNIIDSANSIVDIAVQSSGAAYIVTNHKFISTLESVHSVDGNSIESTFVVGDPRKLHDITQVELTSNSPVGMKSDNMPSIISIQNTEYSGIIFGAPNTTIKEFGHLVKGTHDVYLFNKFVSNSTSMHTSGDGYVRVGDIDSELGGADVILNPSYGHVKLLGAYDTIFNEDDTILYYEGATKSILGKGIVVDINQGQNINHNTIPTTQAVFDLINANQHP